VLSLTVARWASERLRQIPADEPALLLPRETFFSIGFALGGVLSKTVALDRMGTHDHQTMFDVTQL
jgi:hypothetical protein